MQWIRIIFIDLYVNDTLLKLGKKCPSIALKAFNDMIKMFRIKFHDMKLPGRSLGINQNVLLEKNFFKLSRKNDFENFESTPEKYTLGMIFKDAPSTLDSKFTTWKIVCLLFLWSFIGMSFEYCHEIEKIYRQFDVRRQFRYVF